MTLFEAACICHSPYEGQGRELPLQPPEVRRAQLDEEWIENEEDDNHVDSNETSE